jgi:lysophospholipase L1-like esterase
MKRPHLLWTVTLLAACATPPTVEEPEPPDDGRAWVSVLELGVENQGWSGEALAHPFDRLPAHAEGVVRDPVWYLSHHSAGLAVRFVSDAPDIEARWTLRYPEFTMDHMADVGISGLDLYARDEAGEWRWVGVGRIRSTPAHEQSIVEDVPPGTHEYLLYLPLYNGVESVALSVSPEFTIAPAPVRPEDERRPIVFYGTSITQGGCASRPGMAYPSIIGRHLHRPIINLGFSGNGKMEPEMAALLAELDPEIYVLDALPNMTAEMVHERAVPFVRTLRDAHPETPIVMIENVHYQSEWFNEPLRTMVAEKNAALHTALASMEAEGIGGVTLVPSAGLLGDDTEPTVDGIHQTDLGFLRMAESLEPVLVGLLEGRD